MSSPFAVKLDALGFPNPQAFNALDAQQYRTLVVFLENEKVRCLAPADRGSLLNFDGGWDAAYAAYLAEAGCPFELPLPAREADMLFALEWLLGRAVELEWQDFTADPQSSALCAAPPPHSSHPQPALDPVVCDNVRALAAELGLPLTSDIPLLLQVCCRVICQLCPAGAADAEGSQSVAQALQALPLGFSTGDAAVDRAAKILRLLYVADLRQTQNNVNEAISRMQQHTADPKTDSRLGRVGH